MSRGTVSRLDHQAIRAVLPHRYPFLLIDRVLELEEGRRLVAVKNVTLNEPFFPGHFPDDPVMPGVLICEAMAQAGALLAHSSVDRPTPGSSLMLAGLDRVRFRRPVYPGDQLRLEVTMGKRRSGIWKMHGDGFVDGQRVAEADLTAAEVAARPRS